MTKHSYSPGKIDYNGSGRNNCKVTLEWQLLDGRFTMSGNIWNPRETDCYSCGQNIEEIANLFPIDHRVQRMADVWRTWHLNDMKAGSHGQTAYLESKPHMTYEEACKALTDAGLNPDPNYLHNGKPYRYGSAWLKVELPSHIIAEIESWSSH